MLAQNPLGRGENKNVQTNLQVCISEGNIDSQLVPSQESSEAIDVITHVSQLCPFPEASPTFTRPRFTVQDFLLELFAGITAPE